MRNRGELAEGWYDPNTLKRAQVSIGDTEDVPSIPPIRKQLEQNADDRSQEAQSSDEDVVGPNLPGNQVVSSSSGMRTGPALPKIQDLELQRGRQQMLSSLFD